MKAYYKHGMTIHYVVERKSIKNTYFRVRANLLYITTNRHISDTQIENYIDRHFSRIYQKIQTLPKTEPDNRIQLWGKIYKLFTAQGPNQIEIIKDVVYADTKAQDIQKIKQLVYQKVLEERLESILPRIHRQIRKFDIDAVPFKFKYFKSKYGSYHRKHKEITINTVLARLDPIYLTYVIYHEYAHAKIFNHSKDFYNLLEQMLPNHKVIQKDLKKIAII